MKNSRANFKERRLAAWMAAGILGLISAGSTVLADETATGRQPRNPAVSEKAGSEKMAVEEAVAGDPDARVKMGELHHHPPVDLDARPIVARSRAAFVRPRRILVEPDGQVIVADWGAGTVVRISADDKTTILLSGLSEPAGLARDGMGNLYVSTHGNGVIHGGTILKLTPMGTQSVFANGLTGPTALAFDPSGNLCVASFDDDSVLRISTSGQMTVLATDIAAPSGLAFDTAGHLFVASSTDGTLYRISPMGEVVLHARGLQVPSDLAFDTEDHLIVANFAGTELVYVNNKGESAPFAVVPKGTIAHAFDSNGNLALLNWDYQMLMRVTMQLTVPCPHCGKPILLRLRPKQRAPEPAKAEKKNPVI